ncbi:MAG TPA: hypothetical protein H9823_03590 [Candidatus Rubneribacter avistercoris]|nr:hypothetical protein [Candidatus Rubneribacter avistercoris]
MSKASGYIAANGQEITEAMIDRWCDAYERGEFPEGEHTVGDVVHGKPQRSIEKTTVLTLKIPIGMKAAINRKAKQQGISASEYARRAIADELLAETR